MLALRQLPSMSALCSFQPPGFPLHVSALCDIRTLSVEVERASAAPGCSSTSRTKSKWRKDRQIAMMKQQQRQQQVHKILYIGDVWTFTSHHLDARTCYFLLFPVSISPIWRRVCENILAGILNPLKRVRTSIALRDWSWRATQGCKTHPIHSSDSPLRSFTSAQAGPSTFFVPCTSHSEYKKGDRQRHLQKAKAPLLSSAHFFSPPTNLFSF